MRIGLTGPSLSGGGGRKRGPRWTVSPTITGTTGVGDTLTSATGTAVGTGTVTYARQWLLNGSIIPGATSSTYVTAAAGSHSCRVTATDSVGSRPRNSNTILTLTSENVWLWNDGTPIDWNDGSTPIDLN